MNIALVLRSAFRPKANWGQAQWVALVRARPGDTFLLLDPEPHPSLEVDGKYKGPRLYDEPNVRDLTGRTPTSRHALALLRECHACVSVDTGLFHVAAAEIPTVGLFGGVPGWARAPLAGDFRILQGDAPCYPCAFASACERPKGVPHCLAHVTGKRVSEVLTELLSHLQLCPDPS